LVTGFMSLLAQSIVRPGTAPKTSATRSTSNDSRATEVAYSEPRVSTGVVSATRLRTALRGSTAQRSRQSVPPMHHPNSVASSTSVTRRTSRSSHGISSQT
jgi:hypothetical protein